MSQLVPTERILRKVYMIRNLKVMLDRDLAELYGVTTGNLNKAVSRNIDRFPNDFMFKLNKREADSLRFQFGSLKRGQHSKYLPRAFTEHGVAMLSSVLNSKKAIRVNIQIMRAFAELRKMLTTNASLAKKLMALERKYDNQFKTVFVAIQELQNPRKIILRGFGEGRK